MSVGPLAAKGTMMRTARSGYGWAAAVLMQTSAAVSTVTAHDPRRRDKLKVRSPNESSLIAVCDWPAQGNKAKQRWARTMPPPPPGAAR